MPDRIPCRNHCPCKFLLSLIYSSIPRALPTQHLHKLLVVNFCRVSTWREVSSKFFQDCLVWRRSVLHFIFEYVSYQIRKLISVGVSKKTKPKLCRPTLDLENICMSANMKKRQSPLIVILLFTL